MGFASRLVRSCLSVTATLTCLMAPGLVRAATIIVNTTGDTVATDGKCTLREAINNANAAGDTTGGDCTAGSGNDTINFSLSGGSGTITLVSSTLPAIANTLTIDGGAQTITVDGANLYQVLVVNPGATLGLANLSIEHGFSSGWGGGIYDHGTLTVTNCTFSGNYALFGGAIFDDHRPLSISNSTFSKNTAAHGGAIYGFGDNSGGGSVLTITYTTISQNSAGSGCGIYNDGGNAKVGNSTFSDNSSGDGCGISNAGNGVLTVSNSTFSNNQAHNARGADIFSSGTASVVSSTFFGNNEQDTSLFTEGGSITVTDSLLIGYLAPGNCDGTILNGGNNISSDGSCGFGMSTGVNGQTIGDGIDPQLSASGLANNGGPTQTIALKSTSPAIDAIPLAECPPTDQRGVTRPDSASETACDIGAYETVDAQPPNITISVPTNTTYALNQAVPSSYTCTDPVAGDLITVCAGPVADGDDIDTASVGVKTFTVNATDSHNLSSSQSVNYTVAYGVCPQYDKTRSVKSGSRIPIKLELCDINGVDRSASGIVVHATGVVMASSNAAQTLQDAGDANPDNDFRFDSTLGTSGGYIFNLSTKGYPSGTFNLQFTAGDDPTIHTASFQVR